MCIDVWERSRGAYLRSNLKDDVSIENVRDKWSEISDLKDSDRPVQIEEALGKFSEALENMESGNVPSSSKNLDHVTKQNVVDVVFPPVEYQYSTNDAILYAIAG